MTEDMLWWLLDLIFFTVELKKLFKKGRRFVGVVGIFLGLIERIVLKLFEKEFLSLN